jgi:hypothetical protein
MKYFICVCVVSDHIDKVPYQFTASNNFLNGVKKKSFKDFQIFIPSSFSIPTDDWRYLDDGDEVSQQNGQLIEQLLPVDNSHSKSLHFLL